MNFTNTWLVRSCEIRLKDYRLLISIGSNETVDEWFASSGITIGIMADTNDRVKKAKPLVYTWRDCFATSLKDIKTTDLIEHSIELEPNAKPVKGSLQPACSLGRRRHLFATVGGIWP